MKRHLIATALASCAFAVGTATPAGAHEPTCSTAPLGIDVHGQHIVRDYVMGEDHPLESWPPAGGVVGEAVRENGGAAVPGGPGPGFHFPMGFAPGASFCTGSRSPGQHLR